MFIVESKSDRAVRKMSRLMFFVALLGRGFGYILTMHFYVEPRPPEPPGLRFFGRSVNLRK